MPESGAALSASAIPDSCRVHDSSARAGYSHRPREGNGSELSLLLCRASAPRRPSRKHPGNRSTTKRDNEAPRWCRAGETRHTHTTRVRARYRCRRSSGCCYSIRTDIPPRRLILMGIRRVGSVRNVSAEDYHRSHSPLGWHRDYRLRSAPNRSASFQRRGRRRFRVSRQRR